MNPFFPRGLSAVALTLVAAAAQAQSTCEPFGTVSVAGGRYIVQNNFFNPSGGTMCINVDSATGAFNITGNNAVPGNGAPSGYPSIYKGCHWGGCTSGSGLPLQVSQVRNAPTRWSTSPLGGGSWDIAYDVWFNQTPTTQGQPDGTEIMVWLNSSGGVQPAGSKTGNVTINGINFDVWTAPRGTAGFNTIWHIVSYKATQPQRSVDFDLKPFFDDAMQRGLLNSSWYLIDVEAGFEGWSNWAGLRSDSFSVDFNTTPSGGGGINTSAWYNVINQSSNACVDAQEQRTANGTGVQQWSCNTNGQANQEWQFRDVGGGYYRIAVRGAADQVIDVSDLKTANGTPLQLWSYGSGANQQWRAESVGNGYYRFVSRASGRCLDVPGRSTANGVRLQIWDCNGTPAQAFRLSPR